MANPQPTTSHLVKTQWQPGVSGNPNGKPKGTVHISTHITNLLEDEAFSCNLRNGQLFEGSPMKAVLSAVVIKAINGDLRAIELLMKYGYPKKHESVTEIIPLPILGGMSSSADV